MTHPRNRRRTNAERTATTRSRILDAAATCLAEFGYSRTSTTVVAKLAGVSRGALLHNFPTRSELVVAAAEHLFEQRLDEVRAAAADWKPGTDRADAVIGMLFEMSRGRTADAVFEVINAARTDRGLRPLVARLSDRFNEAILSVYGELFPRPSDPELDVYHDAVPVLFMAITDGIAVQRIAGGDAFARQHDRVLELTRYLSHQLLELQDPDPEEDPP
jgi:AcrR family transcriptional regulator